MLEDQIQALKRQIESEKRTAKSHEAMLRISMALPEYPELEDLLDYITGEIKRLLETQGALVILLDEEKKEFFFPSAADDDKATEARVKEIRLPMDSLASGEVVKTGTPLIVNDAYKDSERYARRNREFGYAFDNYVLVPIKSHDRIIGVLAAFNKSEGIFENPDMKLLEIIAGTVGLSIENARFSDELKQSYKALQSIDRVKTRAINHLSHELRTPAAVFGGTLQILEKKLSQLPDDSWKRSMERAWRNLERIKHLQDEIRDIILEEESGPSQLLTDLVDQCTDLLESTIENETGDTAAMDRVRDQISGFFKRPSHAPETIQLGSFARDSLEQIRPEFAHRQLDIDPVIESTAQVFMAQAPLKKVITGLIKNAVENTPDGGRIELIVSDRESGPSLSVKDYGVGIRTDHQKTIFKGFFPTQKTAAYSSKRPFEFNAGGGGADLLRMKIFAGQFNFTLGVSSTQCTFIRDTDYSCPGNIDSCRYCSTPEDCHASGGAVFTVSFQPFT